MNISKKNLPIIYVSLTGTLLGMIFTFLTVIPSTNIAYADKCERDECTSGIVCSDSGAETTKCDMIAMNECETLDC